MVPRSFYSAVDIGGGGLQLLKPGWAVPDKGTLLHEGDEKEGDRASDSSKPPGAWDICLLCLSPGNFLNHTPKSAYALSMS